MIDLKSMCWQVMNQNYLTLLTRALMLKAGAGKIEETKKVMQHFENIKKFQPLTPEPLLQNT